MLIIHSCVGVNKSEAISSDALGLNPNLPTQGVSGLMAFLFGGNDEFISEN